MSRPLLLNTYAPACSELIPTGSNVAILRTSRGNRRIRGCAQPAVWDARALPETQEVPWMPDPNAVEFDWGRVGAMLGKPRL